MYGHNKPVAYGRMVKVQKAVIRKMTDAWIKQERQLTPDGKHVSPDFRLLPSWTRGR